MHNPIERSGIHRSYKSRRTYRYVVEKLDGDFNSIPARHSEFSPIHTIFVPLVHQGPGLHALDMARPFGAQIALVGVVVVPPEQSLSTGAIAARALRRLLRIFGRDNHITSQSQVIVAYEPWLELSKLLQDAKPDLLCLEFESHLKALRVTLGTVLTRPPCNVALVRGKINIIPKQVLIPVRGGPHAELALRVGLGLQSHGVTTCIFAIQRILEPEKMHHSKD